MTRRTFVTLAATLFSWFTIAPKVRADAINGSFKTPNRPDRVVLSLWDGADRVESLWTSKGKTCRHITSYASSTAYSGRPIGGLTGPIFVEHRGHGAVFVYRGEIHEQVDNNPVVITRRYEYVSGPKWWER